MMFMTGRCKRMLNFFVIPIGNVGLQLLYIRGLNHAL